MDFATISSIVLFVISIITFISGLVTKAQNDGKVLASIEQIQQDLLEIKTTLKEKSQDVERQKIISESQDCRIKYVEETCEKLDKRILRLEAK